MKDTILVDVNGGSGGGGGGSMDVATPSGTLYDSAGWANEVGSFGGRETDPFGGAGGNPAGRDSYGNAERVGGISSIRLNLDSDSVRLIDKWVNDLSLAETTNNDIVSLDFGVEGKIPLGAGFELTTAPGGDVGLSWKSVSLSTEEVSLTTPSPGLAATVGGRFEGQLFMGFVLGPGHIRMIFDLKNFRNEMEEWHRQATRKIYGSFPNLGGSGFNTSDLP